MDLNKIKLLKKEELLQKLKQSGFAEVANILENKDVNGHMLIELKEFEIFKWKLNPSQKKTLWSCIKQIKDKPSILMVREKPKVIQKTVATREGLESIELNQKFKNQLQGLLGASATSVGGSSTLPKVTKKTTRPLSSIQNESKPTNKAPHPPPPPSPPPRNDAAKNTNISSKKSTLRLPSKNDDAYYLEMHPPAGKTKPSNNDDDYLAPISAPSMPQNSKNKSPNLPKRMIQKEVRSTKLPEDHLEEENTYELSPPVENIRDRRSPNVSNRRVPLKAGGDEEMNTYEKVPTYQNSKTGSKTYLKDIENHALVVDESASQQESKFSFLTSKLNIFKTMNKPKILYENYDIQGEKSGQTEISVRNRPLPDIPLSPIPVRGRTSSQSSRPAFPRPRQRSSDSNSQENYVELVSNFDHSATQVKAESDDENLIYENTSKTQNLEEGLDEEQLIYENTSKGEDSDDIQQIYENAADVIESTNKKSKKLDDRFSPKQLPHRDNRRKAESRSPLEPKPSVDYVQPPMVQTLALLLSQKLMERDQKLKQQQEQQQHQERQQRRQQEQQQQQQQRRQQEQHRPQHQLITESGTDSEMSEFDDDDLPIYGNVSNDNENDPSPIPEEVIEEVDPPTPPRMEDRKIPAYKRALPEIPRANLRVNATLVKTSPPSPRRASSRKPGVISSNKGLNGKQAESLPGPSKPSTQTRNYEEHSMQHSKAKPNRQPAGLKAKKEDEMDSGNIFNLSEEPFYRDTDRKGAKQILSRFENGAFLFRPSQAYFLVLTVKHNRRVYNIGIERSANNKLRLNTEGNVEPPEFSTLHQFVEYFTEEPVTFENGNELVEIYLKTYLQNDKS